MLRIWKWWVTLTVLPTVLWYLLTGKRPPEVDVIRKVESIGDPALCDTSEKRACLLHAVALASSSYERSVVVGDVRGYEAIEYSGRPATPKGWKFSAGRSRMTLPK